MDKLPKHLAEKVLKHKIVYHGGIINVEKQKVKIPDGRTAERDVVHNAHAVGALVLDKNDNIILERQWREPVQQVTWEIPAGKVDSRDHGSSVHAMKRELNEELRITLDRHIDNPNATFKRLCSFFSSPGFSDEYSTLYLVHGYHVATKDLPRDKGEYLKLYHVSFTKAVKMIHTGQIKDSKTILAILYWSILRPSLLINN